MGIDLRAFIEDDHAVRDGGYSGAIFLTYTLNLNFFEQIIAPALDRAGCANVLVVADPDGYAEAIQMGYRTITGCGLRYVCAPIQRPGRGVQHAKMLLMAGAKHGKLLIGSGNLTYHGYGRNLELYSCFEFDVDKPDPIALYALQQAWKLIQKLKGQAGFPRVALDQISTIQEKTTWLVDSIEENDDFQVWNNLYQPIWPQIKNWRQRAGITEPTSSVIMISPFFDKDVHAVKQIVSELTPGQIKVVVDPTSTNLNGKVLRKGLKDYHAQLMGIKTVEMQDQDSHKRPLHAKALIGIEKHGTWCISGSANMTVPALLKSWQTGGNLELVTFQWSENRKAFDYLLEDPTVHVWSIDTNSLEGTIDEPSDQPKQSYSSFFIEFLSLHGIELNGKVNNLSTEKSVLGQLRFLRTDKCFPITLETDGTFQLILTSKLSEAEAVSLEVNGMTTPYRWVDQPDILARFGERSYHERIQRKMETFDGAGRLFEELLNFLWSRTNPEKVQEQQANIPSRSRTTNRPDDENQTVPNAPLPSNFIISERELLNRLNHRIGRQTAYDRNTWSLRDLLSIILLRLTATTQQDSDTIPPDENLEKERQTQEIDEHEREAQTRKRLRDYVVSYCRRYGHRLVEDEFLSAINPCLLFENHFTLGRVLLELSNKGEKFPEFTNQDLRECIWWLWAPLVWPSILGLSSRSALVLLEKRFSFEEISSQWNSNQLSSLVILMLYKGFGHPPHWKEGLRNTKLAALHLTVKELINKFEKQFKNQPMTISESGIKESAGFRSLVEITNAQETLNGADIRLVQQYLPTIKNYRSPAEERLLPIINIAAHKYSDTNLIETSKLLLTQNDLLGEWKVYQENPKRIYPIMADEDDEGNVYCVCGGSLTKNAVTQLKSGKLILCTSNKDAWLYQKIRLPSRII